MTNTRMLLLLMLANCSLQVNAQVMIDGSISFSEFTDTVGYKPKIRMIKSMVLKSNQESIYLGIQNSAMGTVNLILNHDNEFIIIHISASTGRAIYKKVRGDSLAIVKPILSLQTNPEDWDYVGTYAYKNISNNTRSSKEIKRDKERCLKNNGYKASTFDEGSYRDFEVLLAKKVFGAYKMLVQYVDSDSSGKSLRAFYPANGIIADQRKIQKLLDALPGTSLKIEFNTKEWIDLSDF